MVFLPVGLWMHMDTTALEAEPKGTKDNCREAQKRDTFYGANVLLISFAV